jgi:hypothetical protein
MRTTARKRKIIHASGTSSLDETLQNWWGQVQGGSIGVGDASFAADSESVVIPLDRGSGAVFAQKTIPA